MRIAQGFTAIPAPLQGAAHRKLSGDQMTRPTRFYRKMMTASPSRKTSPHHAMAITVESALTASLDPVTHHAVSITVNSAF